MSTNYPLAEPCVIFTVGHSIRSLDEFVKLLRHYGIRLLVDVRTIPRSRHNPQFNIETLGPSLRNRRIGYRHMKELGGLPAVVPIRRMPAGAMPHFAALPIICRRWNLTGLLKG